MLTYAARYPIDDKGFVDLGNHDIMEATAFAEAMRGLPHIQEVDVTPHYVYTVFQTSEPDAKITVQTDETGYVRVYDDLRRQFQNVKGIEIVIQDGYAIANIIVGNPNLNIIDMQIHQMVVPRHGPKDE